MAIDDESFYNIIGEEISRAIIVDELINFFTLLHEVGDTQITDFNEGSEIRGILEGLSVVAYWLLEEQTESGKTAFVSTAEGEYLDKHGSNPWMQQPRDLGTEATGYVTFSIPEPAIEDIIIPEGTIVVCEETGKDYYTENECIIGVGETTATATIICATEGEDGNVGVGEINIIDDDYLDIPELSVTNEEALTGGTDYEEDEEYRQRLLNYIQRDDFGSLPYYQDLVENVTGVHDAVFIDDTHIPKVYAKIIYVNVNSGYESVEVISSVLEIVTMITNLVVGHTFDVKLAIPVNLDLIVNLTVSELIDETELQNIIQDFFNGGDTVLGFEFEGLGIGETLMSNSLLSTIEDYDTFESVEIINDDTGELLEDISVEDTEVIKLNSVVINQSVN